MFIIFPPPPLRQVVRVHILPPPQPDGRMVYNVHYFQWCRLSRQRLGSVHHFLQGRCVQNSYCDAGVYKTVIVTQVDTVQWSSLYNKTGWYSVYHFLSCRWIQCNCHHFIVRVVQCLPFPLTQVDTVQLSSLYNKCGTVFTISFHAG